VLIKRVQPMSLGKILGVLYAVIGLFIGLIFSLVSIAFPGFGSAPQQQEFPGWSLLFGVGAVVLLPLFYGALGFVGGLISAALYNGLSQFVGGVVIEVE
jgi:hypothetical protein